MAAGQLARLARIDGMVKVFEARWKASLDGGDFASADVYGRAAYRAGMMWNRVAFNRPAEIHRAINRNQQLASLS